MTANALQGKTALVTGAASGIGRETVLAFCEAGASVVATARRASLLDDLASEASGTVWPMAGDLTEHAFIKRLASYRDIDILVNSAGRTAHAPFLESEPGLWEQAWQINVHALMCLSHAIALRMVERRTGHIINLTSVLARQVYPYSLAYAATKHAVAAVTRGLRIELAEHNIRVTEVAPGLVDSELMNEVVHPEVRAAYARRSKDRIPAAEVARMIVHAAGAAPGTVPDVIALTPIAQI